MTKHITGYLNILDCYFEDLERLDSTRILGKWDDGRIMKAPGNTIRSLLSEADREALTMPRSAIAEMTKNIVADTKASPRAKSLGSAIAFVKSLKEHATINGAPIHFDEACIKRLESRLVGAGIPEYLYKDTITLAEHVDKRILDIDHYHNELAALGCDVENMRHMTIDQELLRQHGSLYSTNGTRALQCLPQAEPLKHTEEAITKVGRKWGQYFTHNAAGQFNSTRTLAFAAGAAVAAGAAYVATRDRGDTVSR